MVKRMPPDERKWTIIVVVVVVVLIGGFFSITVMFLQFAIYNLTNTLSDGSKPQASFVLFC